MSGFLARVQNGRLVIDESTGRPEGTVPGIVVDDDGDEGRAGLHATVEPSLENAEAGRVRAAADVVAWRRPRRETPRGVA